MTALASAPIGRTRAVLLASAGTNRAVLAKCPTEVEARTSLGVAVTIPTVLAAVGAAATLVNLNASFVVIVVGAVLVAGLVAALDRLLITTPNNWLSAGVRVVVTLAMATLIGEALLHLVFATEINQALADVHETEARADNAELVKGYDSELARLDARLAALATLPPGYVAATTTAETAEVDLAAALAEVDRLQVELAAEIAGTTDIGTGRAGDGPVADTIRAEIALANITLDQAIATRDRALTHLEAVAPNPEELAAAATETEALRSVRASVEANRSAAMASGGQAVLGAVPGGVLARAVALEELARSNQAVAVQVWAVRVLLLGLDTLPLTVKFALSRRSARPYDALHAAYQSVELHRARTIAADYSATGPVDQAPSPGQQAPRRRRRGFVGGQVVEIDPDRPRPTKPARAAPLPPLTMVRPDPVPAEVPY